MKSNCEALDAQGHDVLVTENVGLEGVNHLQPLSLKHRNTLIDLSTNVTIDPSLDSLRPFLARDRLPSMQLYFISIENVRG